MLDVASKCIIISWKLINLCHFVSSSWCQGLAATSACGSSSVNLSLPPGVRGWLPLLLVALPVSLCLFLLVSGVGCVFCLWLFLDFSVYLYDLRGNVTDSACTC